MSSGSPSIQALEAGRGEQVVERIASAKRSLAGKNDSRSSTPTRFTGGVWICWMSAGEVEVVGPAARRRRGWSAIRMCSRLLIGIGVDAEEAEEAGGGGADALAQQLLVVADRRGGGAANDLRIETGMPALLPGRVDREVGRVAQALDPRAVLAPSASPFFHSSACCARVRRPARAPSGARRPR